MNCRTRSGDTPCMPAKVKAKAISRVPAIAPPARMVNSAEVGSVVRNAFTVAFMMRNPVREEYGQDVTFLHVGQRAHASQAPDHAGMIAAATMAKVANLVG